MSWYTRPLQPFDPVVVSQQPKPPIRYFRENFTATGQNSFTAPPAQDPAMWAQLRNTMPIVDGTIRGRWGYALFRGHTEAYNRLYTFQSDNTGLRAVILTGTTNVKAVDELGSNINGNVFTPIGGNGGVIRSATSRNYQYFCDGNIAPVSHRTGDSLKWNGATSGGTTNWGIDGTDITQSTTGGGGTSGGVIGPSTGTTASNVAGTYGISWSTPSGAFTNSFVAPANATTSYSASSGTKVTDSLKMTGFFSSASGSSVLGIQATFSCKTVLGGSGGIPSRAFTAQLVKNGTAVGTAKTITAFDAQYGSNNPFTISFGSSSDTWGTSFTPNDLTQSNFGIIVYISSNIAISTSCVATCDIGYVTITATLQGGAGTSTNSGNGVGVTGLVGGGAVNLTIGRQYYLVANNSSTGHFSDLSGASGSTGSCANSEVNLILATYNDTQVDTKYVLATADGGDPSILYQVNVLAPTAVPTNSGTSGMNITSWAINGANVATFTGTFTSGQFKVGAKPIIGGLSHGSYLNNQTLTVTSTTATTFVASFTHGADSATENGVAGSYTFAIPNSVTLVVDDNSDPLLVLQQTMAYTDQFGGTFGVALNDPPPAGTIVQKHQGRLWMSGVIGSTHSVYFSKGVADLTLPNGFIAGIYEESWPASNYFDVSDGAESVAGLLSDGQTLYIGTQNHIRRVIGNDPTNFNLPEIVHPNTGVMNQEVWQLIYTEGSPSGSIWITPDFRVIMSDFNTYVDIGTPIQDLLNQIQAVGQVLSHGVYLSRGPFELYILAVPIAQTTYCDYQLVYDLRAKQWHVWNLNVGTRAMLFNITADGFPQWFFQGGVNAVNQWLIDPAFTLDDNIAIPTQATTSWLHMGEPTRRKILNEIQIYGNTNMVVNVWGANNQADFASPVVVASNLPLVQTPFGSWNAYLIDSVCKYKYYQIQFSLPSAASSLLLGSYGIYAQPLEDM